MLKNKLENSDDFNTLAFKLRMQRYDKETVHKLKTDVMKFEREKNRKRRAVIKIQKFIRGSLSRKKFNAMMDEINTNIVIEYIRAKRKERIRSCPEQIISYYLHRHIQKKRDIRRIIFFDYLNYCGNMIKKVFIGFRMRKNFMPTFKIYKDRRSKICDCLNSFKIRLILRSNRFQDALVEISNIKSCLLTLMSDERNSDKTEKLKRDFAKRLPKLQKIFYEEFYNLKNNKKWVYYPKVNKHWLQSYLNILSTVNLQPLNIFNENPNITNKSQQIENLHASSEKMEKIEVEEQFDKTIERKEITEQNYERIEEMNEPNAEEKQLENNYAIEEHEKEEFENNQDHEERPENDQENEEEILNERQGIDYEDRPIKVNPHKINEFYKMIEEYRNEEQNKAKNNENKKESSPLKKINKQNKIKRVPPKYDARKAIEESKNNNNLEGTGGNSSSERNNFREFLKKLKEDSNPNKKPDDKLDKNKNDLITLSAKKDLKNKDLTIKEHFHTEAGNMETIQLEEYNSSKTVRNEEKTRRKKIVSNEINLRRKLHELEKSPPPRIDVKNIKSKIDCWTFDNPTITNQKIKKPENIIDLNTNINHRDNYIDKMIHDYESINLELTDYLKKKSDNMKEVSNIPFIKMDSFYIKHYSSEIYEQLLMHLNKHYEELKN